MLTEVRRAEPLTTDSTTTVNNLSNIATPSPPSSPMSDASDFSDLGARQVDLAEVEEELVRRTIVMSDGEVN